MNGWTDSIFQLSSKLMSKGEACRLEVDAAICLVWGYLHRLTDTELHLMTGVSYKLVATYTRGLRTLLMAQQVADQDCLTLKGLSGDVEVDETAIRRTRVADDTQISGYQVLHRRYIGMIIRGTHDVCVFQLPEKLVQTGAPPAPIRKEEWIPVSKFVKPRPGPVDHDNVTIVHSDGAKAYLVHTPDGAYSMNVVHSKKQYVAHKPLIKNGVKIKGSDGHTIRRQTGTQAADAFWRTMKRGIPSSAANDSDVLDNYVRAEIWRWRRTGMCLISCFGQAMHTNYDSMLTFWTQQIVAEMSNQPADAPEDHGDNEDIYNESGSSGNSEGSFSEVADDDPDITEDSDSDWTAPSVLPHGSSSSSSVRISAACELDFSED